MSFQHIWPVENLLTTVTFEVELAFTSFLMPDQVSVVTERLVASVTHIDLRMYTPPLPFLKSVESGNSSAENVTKAMIFTVQNG